MAPGLRLHLLQYTYSIPYMALERAATRAAWAQIYGDFNKLRANGTCDRCRNTTPNVLNQLPWVRGALLG
jgi:hypothetical protein